LIPTGNPLIRDNGAIRFVISGKELMKGRSHRLLSRLAPAAGSLKEKNGLLFFVTASYISLL